MRRPDVAHHALFIPPAVTRRRYAAALAALTFLFALRVLGQAIQRWAPVDALPPFEAFQGSNLPYWLLLSAQLGILVWMSVVTYGIGSGTRGPNMRAARILGWLGAVYMAGSLARIAVGLVLPDPPPWFTAWISGVFHVILAAYVLTLAAAYAATSAAASRTS